MQSGTSSKTDRHVRVVPFDLETISRWPEWREHFVWPLDQQETQELCGPVLKWLAQAIRDVPDSETARIAEASATRVMNVAQPAIHAGYLLAAATRKGLTLVAELPQMRYLQGEMCLEEISTEILEGQFIVGPAPKLPLLRDLVRPRYWTPWQRIPATLVAPQATAINHNDMLEDRARFTGTRVNYLDARHLYREVRPRLDPKTVDYARADDAADALVAAVPIPVGLDSGHEKRLRQYLSKIIHAICRFMAEALAAMRAVRRLPMTVWNGSGGNLPGAIIASEVLRRGGRVTAFDHVTGRGLERVGELTVLHALTLASCFVVATPATAERLRRQNVHELQHPRRRTEIIGNHGYPRVRDLDLTARTPRAAGQKRRVTYVSPMFRGWRQATPPTTADPVQLDWELRLVEALNAMPIELTCRPHPEGVLNGLPHPLARLADVSEHPFERLIEGSDLFLFDWYRSSTFWIALCTDRPIVMIELGYSYRDVFFSEEIGGAIERRCRFVRAHTDDRNRLIVDKDELADAILSAPEKVDASEFQALLIGETR